MINIGIFFSKLVLCFKKCLKGFELPDETILDSGKITILNSLLEEKKEMVNY